MKVTNHHVKTTTENGEVQILTGSSNSTVVKSLEIISGSDPSVINIYRKTGDNGDSKYGEIKLDLAANNYVMLWEGFIAIPSGHKLLISANKAGIEAIASVVEL